MWQFKGRQEVGTPRGQPCFVPHFFSPPLAPLGLYLDPLQGYGEHYMRYKALVHYQHLAGAPRCLPSVENEVS